MKQTKKKNKKPAAISCPCAGFGQGRFVFNSCRCYVSLMTATVSKPLENRIFALMFRRRRLSNKAYVVITSEFGIWQSTDILHYFEGVRLKQRGIKDDLTKLMVYSIFYSFSLFMSSRTRCHVEF